MKIWLVYGETGDYADHHEWVVDAWPTEEQANARVQFLTEKMRELGLNDRSRDGKAGWTAAKKEMRKEDVFFDVDYGGMTYSVGHTELKS